MAYGTETFTTGGVESRMNFPESAEASVPLLAVVVILTEYSPSSHLVPLSERPSQAMEEGTLPFPLNVLTVFPFEQTAISY